MLLGVLPHLPHGRQDAQRGDRPRRGRALPAPRPSPPGFSPARIVIFVMLMACACWYVFTPRRASVADVAVTAFGPLYTSLAFSSVRAHPQVRPPASRARWSPSPSCSPSGPTTPSPTSSAPPWGATSSPRASRRARASRASSGASSAPSSSGSCSPCFVVGDMSVAMAVLCGLVVGVAGVIGDLFESRLKRGVGVKDSGNVLPRPRRPARTAPTPCSSAAWPRSSFCSLEASCDHLRGHRRPTRSARGPCASRSLAARAPSAPRRSTSAGATPTACALSRSPSTRRWPPP